MRVVLVTVCRVFIIEPPCPKMVVKPFSSYFPLRSIIYRPLLFRAALVFAWLKNGFVEGETHGICDISKSFVYDG